MRYTTFALGVFGAVLGLGGAIMGLGMAGVGFAFGGGGLIAASTAVGIAMTMAIAILFLSVAVMFVRDIRLLGLVVLIAAIGMAIAGGPYALPGSILGIVAAILAQRVDPVRPLV